MLSLVVALFFLFITPGPGVLSLACVGAAFGFRAGVRYCVGLLAGANLVWVACALGIGAIFNYPYIKLIFLAISSVYLCFLSFKIIAKGLDIKFSPAHNTTNMWEGGFLQIFNPKAYAVGIFIFSGFPLEINIMGMESVGGEIVAKLIATNIVWIPIHYIWLMASVRLQSLQLTKKTQTKINVVLGVGLLLVVIISGFSI